MCWLGLWNSSFAAEDSILLSSPSEDEPRAMVGHTWNDAIVSRLFVLPSRPGTW